MPATRGIQRGQLGPDAGVVQAGADRVGLLHLTVRILEQVGHGAVQDSRRSARERRRMAPLEPFAAGLHTHETDAGLSDEPRQQADGVGAATDTGDGDIGLPAFPP